MHNLTTEFQIQYRTKTVKKKKINGDNGEVPYKEQTKNRM